MPARKRGQEGKKQDSWTLMLSELTRAETEARVRRDHPEVAKVLDWMVSRFPVYKDGYGFTVFSDWILQYIEKAKRQWPDDLRRFSSEELYTTVFPHAR